MAEVDDLELVRVASVRRWAAKAEKRIADRLADAAAHASNALTKRAQDARDGRATRLAVIATRGHKAAQGRLGELAADLWGLAKDARRSFYRESHELLKGSVPDEIAAKDAGPTKAGEREAVALVIHGAELKDEIGAAVAEAARHLTSTTAAAASSGWNERTAQQSIDTWEGRTRGRIGRLMATILSDSEVAIFNKVGHELIDESFHAED